MSLTLVFILQPYFAGTWRRTLERVIGSVAGAIGASLLGLLLSTPLSVALAVLPIALGTFAARTVHYALFTFFLTSQFVLVSHIQQPDIYEPMLAALRAFNSVLGGVLALLVGFLVWPEKEPRQLAGALSRALEHHAAYALALIRAKSGAGAAGDIVGLRRQACLSADNAEASLQRLQQNPVHRDRKVDTAVNLLNAMRRVTAAGTVLEIQPPLPPDSPAAPALRDYGLALAHALHPQEPEPAVAIRQLALPAAVAAAAPTLAGPLERIAQQARQVRQLRDRVQQA
ncbi:Predicted membrane protein [Achromobacter xylosoxidans]|nr:Predicted membrane protein [Achromobacter xylosoxidans]